METKSSKVFFSSSSKFKTFFIYSSLALSAATPPVYKVDKNTAPPTKGARKGPTKGIIAVKPADAVPKLAAAPI